MPKDVGKGSSVVGRGQQTGLKADGELKKVSRRPAGRFNVVQCSSISPTLEDGSSAESRRDMVVQYIIPSNPDVTLTFAVSLFRYIYLLKSFALFLPLPWFLFNLRGGCLCAL